MGFKEVKRQVITCLRSGQIMYEMRNTIEDKNLLLNGEVSIAILTEILLRARGDEYVARPHHLISGVDVHFVKRQAYGENWYIKWYYTSPNCIFISVHH